MFPVFCSNNDNHGRWLREKTWDNRETEPRESGEREHSNRLKCQGKDFEVNMLGVLWDYLLRGWVTARGQGVGLDWWVGRELGGSRGCKRGKHQISKVLAGLEKDFGVYPACSRSPVETWGSTLNSHHGSKGLAPCSIFFWGYQESFQNFASKYERVFSEFCFHILLFKFTLFLHISKISLHACMLSRFSHVWLSVTIWTVIHQASLSMGFFRQEYWLEWVAVSPPGALLDPEMEPSSLMSYALADKFFTTSTTWGIERFFFFIIKNKYNLIKKNFGNSR